MVESCTDGVLNEAEVIFDAVVVSNSPDRFGIGLFINLDGESAITGDRCLHDFLSPFSSNEGDWNEVEVNGGVFAFAEPFPNINPTPDQCGDIPGNSRIVKQLQQVRIQCNDLTGDGFVDINACASWENNQNAQCDGLGDAVPGTPSKCGCTDVETGLALPASLTIRKVTTEGDGTFEFSTTSAPAFDQTFTLPETFQIETDNGAGEENFGGAVEPGTYTIDETVPDDWRLDSVSCTNGDDPTPEGGGVTLGPGDEVTCTFTNSPIVPGSVTIIKNAQGGDASFGYTGGLDSFTLTTVGGTDSQTFNDVSPGTYDVTESIPAGWDLVSITCSNDSDVDLDNATASVSVGEDESVSCTFTNAKRGSITISKETLPAGGAGFNFTEDFTDTGSFSLDDGENITFGDLVAGDYSVSEQVPSGWDLTGISCTGGSDVTTDLDQASVDIGLNPGEEMECTFTNTQRGSLTIVKKSDGEDRTFEFTGNTPESPFTIATEDNSGSKTFDDLQPPVVFDVSETVPEGWVLEDAFCDNEGWDFIEEEARLAGIQVGPGEDVTCTFENTQLGSFTVVKKTDPEGSAQEFTFTGNADGTLTDGERIELEDLLPGTYTSSEQVPDGWSVSIACEGDEDSEVAIGDNDVSVDLAAGEDVVCTFTNTIDRGSITIIKETRPDDDQAFTFSRNFGDDFSLTNADTEGAKFTLLPNSESELDSYLVTEQIPDTGWDLTAIECTSNGGEIGDNVTPDLEQGSVEIVLNPGEDVVCTFENTKRGSLTVKKLSIGGDGEFDFFSSTLDPDAFSILTMDGEGYSQVFDGLQPGEYDVFEIDPGPEWAFQNVSCNVGPEQYEQDGDDQGNVGVILDLLAGQEVVCTFENGLLATVSVTKRTIGGDDTFGFEFERGAELVEAFDLTTSGGTANREFENLAPGSYAFTETVLPVNWELTDVYCTHNGDEFSGDLENATVAFELDFGDTVNCAFENTADGKIIVRKFTDPEGSEQEFEFVGPEGSDLNGFLTDGGELEDYFQPGSYTVSEIIPEGWGEPEISCETEIVSETARLEFAGIQGVDAPRQASETIELAAGETVICEFHNTQFGSLTIVKATDPAGSSREFTFTGDAAGTLTDGQSIELEDLMPAVYTSAEDVPEGWSVSIACEGAVNSGVTIGENDVGVDLAAGEDVTCTFTNTIERGSITVTKVADPDDTGQVFQFASNFAGDFGLAHGQSEVAGNLVPSSEAGLYSVSENVPDGWDLLSAICDNGDEPSAIDLQPGQDVTCTFTNAQDRGEIIVAKVADPADTAQTFQFNPSWGASFSLGAGASQGSGPLVAGSYSVSETVPAGWTLESASCDNGDDPSAISLGAGETVTCTFTNAIDRGTIVVNKVADPADTGQQFSFSSNFAGDFTLGAGGSLSTGDLLPSSEAGTYSVSETVPAGWTLESATCDGGNTPEAIDLQPGQTVTCTFTNQLRQIVIDRVEEICENDAPFVDYEIQTLGFGNGLTIRWVFVSGPNAGEPAQVLGNQPLSGRLLWPGAEIDADGQGINWPGWEFIPGEGWIEVSTNLRPSLLLEFEANPTVSQVVNYPPATTVCSPRPPADPEDPIRVPTLSAFGLIILAMLMLLLAGFGTRRHGLTR